MISTLVELKSQEQIKTMSEGARLTLDTINFVRDHIRVGQSTQDLDDLVKQRLQALKCEPAFLNYKPEKAPTPFPSHSCICINEEVFHAPGSLTKKINRGDLVTIDLGIKYKGLYADCADTFLIGESNPQKLALIDACSRAIHAALPLCVPGSNVQEVTKMIDKTIRDCRFHPVENFGGHGIGTQMHMAPFIPNSTRHLVDCELAEGMVICLEPACSLRWDNPKTAPDNWTIRLSAGNLSAHVERMVSVRHGSGVILE